MTRVSINSLAATVLGGLVLASLLLFSGNQRAVEASHGPVLGSVDFVSLDMDITVPGVQTSASIPVGSTVLIDVLVDEIHPLDGYQGASFNLLYDPAVVEVTSKAYGVPTFSPGPLLRFSQPLPDTDGNWRYDEFDLFGVGAGEKAIVRLVITCIAGGQSFLDLADNIGGDGIPDIFVPPAGAPIGPGGVLSSSDAQIGCSPAAVQADVEIKTETINGPAAMDVNTPTAYTADSMIINNGPQQAGLVDVVLATSIISPANCSANVDSSPVTITAVSAANPAVVTAPGHGLLGGETVVISGVGGTHTAAAFRDVNHVHDVTFIDNNKFSLDGVENHQAATSFGFVKEVIGTSHAALSAVAVPKSVPLTLECSNDGFHNFEISTKIFLDLPKLYGSCSVTDSCEDAIQGNQEVEHNGAGTSPPGAGTTESPATSPGDKLSLAVGCAPNVITSSTVTAIIFQNQDPVRTAIDFTVRLCSVTPPAIGSGSGGAPFPNTTLSNAAPGGGFRTAVYDGGTGIPPLGLYSHSFGSSTAPGGVWPNGTTFRATFSYSPTELEAVVVGTSDSPGEGSTLPTTFVPVGGIVELLTGGSDAPASDGDGIGGSFPSAAVAAAGALVLAAGGWYARRRWLR